MPLEPIAPGLHESLVTTDLHRHLALLNGLDVTTSNVDPADLPHVLAQHVYASAHHAFTSRNPEEAVALANQLIETLQATGTEVTAPASQLLRVAPAAGPGVAPIQTSGRGPRSPKRP